MSKIFIYTPVTNKYEFYGKMGKFFAERNYQIRLPYLVNSSTTTWIVVEKNNDVIGFGSFEEKNRGIEIGEIYTAQNDDQLWMKIVREITKLIQAKNPELVYTVIEKRGNYQYFLENGFNLKRESKNYYFLEKREGIKIENYY